MLCTAAQARMDALTLPVLGFGFADGDGGEGPSQPTVVLHVPNEKVDLPVLDLQPKDLTLLGNLVEETLGLGPRVTQASPVEHVIEVLLITWPKYHVAKDQARLFVAIE